MEDKKDKITLDASDRVDEKGRRYEDLRNDLKDDENYDKACEDTMEFVYQERQKKPLNIPFYEKEPPKKNPQTFTICTAIYGTPGPMKPAPSARPTAISWR